MHTFSIEDILIDNDNVACGEGEFAKGDRTERDEMKLIHE